MLLMQYNDNIPAVFGFPPSDLSLERRNEGGQKERRESSDLGSASVFVLSSTPLFFFPFTSTLIVISVQNKNLIGF